MKVHVMSDLHLEFGAFKPPRPKADVVVLAGDIDIGARGIEWAKKNFRDVPVIYVSGNHEHYKRHLQKNLQAMRDAAQGKNVIFLENDATAIADGDVWGIGDVSFVGCTLWTDFDAFGDATRARQVARAAMTDYRAIRTADYRTLRPYETGQLHAHSVKWLEGEFESLRDKKLVVVSHHAPSLQSIPDGFRHDPLSASFSSDLDWLVKVSGARLWVHGHTHDSLDYRIDRTRVICNPRGYVGVEPNPRFDPSLVVEV